MGEGMGEGTGGGMGGGMGEGTGEDCGWRGGVAAWRVVSLACSRPLREAQLRATKTAEARRAAASKRRPLAFHTTGAEPHMAIDERRKYVTGTCDAARLGLRLGFGVGLGSGLGLGFARLRRRSRSEARSRPHSPAAACISSAAAHRTPVAAGAAAAAPPPGRWPSSREAAPCSSASTAPRCAGVGEGGW